MLVDTKRDYVALPACSTPEVPIDPETGEPVDVDTPNEVGYIHKDTQMRLTSVGAVQRYPCQYTLTHLLNVPPSGYLAKLRQHDHRVPHICAAV